MAQKCGSRKLCVPDTYGTPCTAFYTQSHAVVHISLCGIRAQGTMYMYYIYNNDPKYLFPILLFEFTCTTSGCARMSCITQGWYVVVPSMLYVMYVCVHVYYLYLYLGTSCVHGTGSMTLLY